ncbi:helix-turn-helix transcriptional regulator [Halopenitus sp. H-Gu1]|uniref:helix-turn-helix transcriptional regulator n=1 Tax=Halopenitus sp. H-Gu1 TaxID=3242697 RepID=UPI00359D16CC
MRSSVSVRAGLCLLLLVVAMAGAVGAAEPAGTGFEPVENPTAIDAETGDPQIDLAGFDRSVIDITVAESGRGVWTLRYERALTNETERDNFEAFAREFNEEETDLYRNFRADASALVTEGENVTDRDMAATGFDREAFIHSSLGNDVGVVELTFTWRGFAAVEADTVIVGDVFEGGFYIGPDQELVIRPGDQLAFESHDPEGTPSNPDSLSESVSITWQGERRFTDRRPRVVFTRNSTADNSTTETSTTTEPGTASSTGGSESPTVTEGSSAETEAPFDGGLLWGLFGIAAVLAVVLAVVFRSRGGGIDRSRASGPSGGGVDDGTPPRAGVSGDDRSSEGDGKSGESPAATPSSLSPPAIADEELLSDEDRIESILREHGGRVKQSRIVDATDWSKSKVSVVLSEMAEEGTVSKLRIGRENVITLDEYDSDTEESTSQE